MTLLAYQSKPPPVQFRGWFSKHPAEEGCLESLFPILRHVLDDV